jgi:hypothetical protein
MAVAAIDSIISYVMFVAELNGLFARDVLPRHVRRARRRQHRKDCKPHQKKKRKDTKSRDEICASMKNLCHVLFALWRGAR